MMMAIVFAVFDCGFIARSALEEDNSGDVRIEKIMRIIHDSKYGIHDISRTDLSPQTNLPRFNMPLELGIFLGARKFGDRTQNAKICMIVDNDRYRYQQFISDIAGQDIKSHGDSPEELIRAIRNWLSTSVNRKLPSDNRMVQRYLNFVPDFEKFCDQNEFDPAKITFNDLAQAVVDWLKVHPP